jgi:UDP-N-acetylmuramoyl-L-alanyl-D-glutamate--2,6-diaminopimelate ligase
MVSVRDLVRELGGELHGSVGIERELRDVQIDSRAVGAGDLFAALPGTSVDGSRFVARGARARRARGALAHARRDFRTGVANWVHPRARAIAGEAAARLLGRPAREMFVVAITGTNGKTTTAHLTGQFLGACGRRPAVLGTAGNRLADGVLHAATHTTPDAPGLQRLLARHAQLGGDSVALEASSHALDQDRLAGLDVSVAVVHQPDPRPPRLPRRHGTLRRRQGAALPVALADSHAVVNADDPRVSSWPPRARARGDGLHRFSTRSRADLSASRLEVDSRGTRFLLEGMGIQRTGVCLPLVGRFNVENALAALAAVLVSGASPTHALEWARSVSPAPGGWSASTRPGAASRVLRRLRPHRGCAAQGAGRRCARGLVAEGSRPADHGGR